MTLGHPEERFDGIGADRQADLIEPSGLRSGKRILQRSDKLLAPGSRGHLGNQWLTLGQGVVAESLGLENLLALQQALGIGSEAPDEVLTRRQLIEARPQTGYAGAVFGPARGRELEQALGPGAQAVYMPKAGFGAHGGWRQTRQNGLCKRPRDAPAGRQEALEGRVMLLIVLEHVGSSVGDIVDAGAGQPLER